jgi:hypothetical protein
VNSRSLPMLSCPRIRGPFRFPAMASSLYCTIHLALNNVTGG